MATSPARIAGRASPAWLIARGAHHHELAFGGELVIDEEHGDEGRDRQHHLDEARQDEEREIEKEADRQAAVDDEIDEPERLQQPDRNAERHRDEHHDHDGLAQDVAGDPVHGAMIIEASSAASLALAWLVPRGRLRQPVWRGTLTRCGASICRALRRARSPRSSPGSSPSPRCRCFAAAFCRSSTIPIILRAWRSWRGWRTTPPCSASIALAWRPIPDLAMDAVVPPLMRFMPLIAAGKLFVLATFLLLAGGSALIHRVVFGRWSAWPCLAFLLLYNRILLWGMLNYLFGLGLALCAFPAAVALRDRGIALRLAAGAVFALALYGAHFAALGVYAVLWLGHEAAPLLYNRGRRGAGALRLGVAALPLLLPAAILVSTASGVGGGVHFGAPGRKLDLLFSVFDLYHRPFDIACFALAVVAAGLCLLAALAGPGAGAGAAGRAAGRHLSRHAHGCHGRDRRRSPSAAGLGAGAVRAAAPGWRRGRGLRARRPRRRGRDAAPAPRPRWPRAGGERSGIPRASAPGSTRIRRRQPRRRRLPARRAQRRRRRRSRIFPCWRRRGAMLSCRRSSPARRSSRSCSQPAYRAPWPSKHRRTGCGPRSSPARRRSMRPARATLGATMTTSSSPACTRSRSPLPAGLVAGVPRPRFRVYRLGGG